MCRRIFLYSNSAFSSSEGLNAELDLYDFDEKTEGVIEDASGNGNHGAIYGGMVGTHFDGADDYVEMPANILDGLDEFTIVMRIKAEDFSINDIGFLPKPPKVVFSVRYL